MVIIIKRYQKLISYLLVFISLNITNQFYVTRSQATPLLPNQNTIYNINLYNDVQNSTQNNSSINDIVEANPYELFIEGEHTEMKKIIWDIASDKGLDPNYILGVCLIETGGTLNPNQLGPNTYCGRAKGLMQIMPVLEKHLKITDIWDPKQNIEAGTQHLKWLLGEYSKDLIYDEHGNYLEPEYVAAIAYNWGHNNVNKMLKKYNCVIVSKLPYETRRYYNLIKRHKSGIDIKGEL